MLLKKLIQDFVYEVRTYGKIELYNEAGLRHEIASFLEQKLSPEDYGVQIEREAQAVVLGASDSVFEDAVLDIYIFERIGRGQFCLQVLAQSHQNQSARDELPKQVKILEQLSAHGFQDCGLFFAYQQPALPAVSASGLISLPAEFKYAVKWEELLPASQDNNGAWQYFFYQLM